MLLQNHKKTRNLHEITSKFSNFRKILNVFTIFNDYFNRIKLLRYA